MREQQCSVQYIGLLQICFNETTVEGVVSQSQTISFSLRASKGMRKGSGRVLLCETRKVRV